MAKKMMAQKKETGRLRTSSGYVMKTRPGPERATSFTVVSCKWAM